MEDFHKEDGTKSSRVKEDFKGIQRSTILHLRTLPVFGTQFAMMQCTKLLVRKMHGGALWLDKEYPIHVEDINQLTELAKGGNKVSTAFQIVAMRDKKQNEDNIYTKYGTGWGRREAKLDSINKDDIIFFYYPIVGKTMWHFIKNECTLDTISVAENCFQGEVFNWSVFVLNELFEPCEDVYRRGVGFMFRYLLMSLVMWKWRLLMERKMVPIIEGQPIALWYDPWKASGDPNTKEINKIAFKD